MTDVVIVGSGIAGLTAALHAADAGCAVTVITKARIGLTNTRFAQGGIAGVMSGADTAAAHGQDTLIAGAGLSDAAAVDVLVSEGPARIRDLIAAGVPFDRDKTGALLTGLEGAHSHPRILHAGGDATGAAIEDTLVRRVRAAGITVVEHAFLVDLVITAGRASGVSVMVGDQTLPVHLGADAVVLATGGAGELYAHTSNPSVATADGIAAAARAGAAVRDLEFFQFHPTVLVADPPLLVSEAVRGEGAVLRDESGRRFAVEAHPDGELAPRDVVARAIASAMTRQGGRPVALDATAVHSPDPAARAAFLAERFPTIDAAVRAAGFDWAREPVPVTPAAHYMMGGVATDLDGRTTVPGLYAVGEAACTGVHGANRLASNSLLEGAVFGARAGRAAATDESGARRNPAATSVSPAADRGPADPGACPTDLPRFSRPALQSLLWADAGIVRTGAGLDRAARILAGWRKHQRTPHSVSDHEDQNLLQVAVLLVDAARRRTASVGAHHRADTPAALEGAA